MQNPLSGCFPRNKCAHFNPRVPILHPWTLIAMQNFSCRCVVSHNHTGLRYKRWTLKQALMSQSVPTAYIAPGNHPEDFLNRSNPGHLDNFFGEIPGPGPNLGSFLHFIPLVICFFVLFYALRHKNVLII